MTKKSVILFSICSALSATGVLAANTAFASSAVLNVTNNSGAPATFNFDAGTGTTSDCTPSTDPVTGTKILACLVKPGKSTFTFDTGYRVYSVGSLPANTQCYTPLTPINAGLQIAGGATIPCTVGGSTPPVAQKPVINTQDLNTVIKSGDHPYSINLKLAKEITPASIFNDSSNISFKPLNGETTLTYNPETFTIAQTGPTPAPGSSVQYELIAKNSAGTDDQTITVTYTKSVTPVTPEQKPVINKQDLIQVVKSGETYNKSLAGEITPSNFFSESDSQISFKPLNGETAVTYDPSTHTIKQTGVIPEGKTIQYELTASNNAGQDDEIINVTFLKQVGPTPSEPTIQISPASLPVAHVKPGNQYQQTFTVSNIDQQLPLSFTQDTTLPMGNLPACEFNSTNKNETCEVVATVPSDAAGKTYDYQIHLSYKGHVTDTKVINVEVDKKPTPPPSSVTVIPHTGVIVYDYAGQSSHGSDFSEDKLKAALAPYLTSNTGNKVPQNVYLDTYYGFKDVTSNTGKVMVKMNKSALDDDALNYIDNTWLQGKSNLYLGIYIGDDTYDTFAAADATDALNQIMQDITRLKQAHPAIKGIYLDLEMNKEHEIHFLNMLTKANNNTYPFAIFASDPDNDAPTLTDSKITNVQYHDRGTIAKAIYDSNGIWLASGYDNESAIDSGNTGVSAYTDIMIKGIRSFANKAQGNPIEQTGKKYMGINYQIMLPSAAGDDGDGTKYQNRKTANNWYGPNSPVTQDGNFFVQTGLSNGANSSTIQQNMYLCVAYKEFSLLLNDNSDQNWSTPNKPVPVSDRSTQDADKLVAEPCGFEYMYNRSGLNSGDLGYGLTSTVSNYGNYGTELLAFVKSHFTGFGLYKIDLDPKTLTKYPATTLPQDWKDYLNNTWGKV